MQNEDGDFHGQDASGRSATDRRIFDDVCAQLGEDAELTASYLRISVRERQVTLDGHVDDEAARSRAEVIALRVRGVTTVANRLRVGERRRPSAFAGDLPRGVFGRLVEEHRTIGAMLDIVIGTPARDVDDRRAAFDRLAREMLAHGRAEEEIVYPALDGSYELGHHVREDRREHDAIERMLADLDALPDGSAEWPRRLTALRDAFEHHVTDEEGLVIPAARYVIDTRHADDLLIAYEREREIILGRLEDAANDRAAHAHPATTVAAVDAHKVRGDRAAWR